MLVLVCLVHQSFFLFCIPFKGKERHAKTNFMLTKLRAVLVSTESDSAECLLVSAVFTYFANISAKTNLLAQPF